MPYRVARRSTRRRNTRLYRRRRTSYRKNRRNTRYVRKRLGMSRRCILNISSKKKRNNIIPQNFTYLGASAGTGPKVMGSDRITFLISRPTALSYDETGASDFCRTSQTVFWRGIRESIDINIAGGAPWRWRRLVFECKGDPVDSLISNVETSTGYNRAMVELSGDPPASIRNQLESLLFQGAGGVDWASVFNAKVDTNRVKLHSDEFTSLRSGNDRGHYHKYKKWYPLNRNMHYFNDENGKDISSSSFASSTIGGMGDVFILDIFQCLQSSADFQLQFSPEATLYWHER